MVGGMAEIADSLAAGVALQIGESVIQMLGLDDFLEQGRSHIYIVYPAAATNSALLEFPG